jgi:aldose 1-epimerase
VSAAETPVAPSGEQVELTLGDQRAVVVEVGGGLRCYSAGGRELLDGYAADERATSGRGQVLVPWPNRIRDGSYEFDGEQQQLALTEPARANAIHGLVRWSPFAVLQSASDRALMAHTIHPQPGYPFTLAVTVEYVLSSAGLTVTTTATNVGATACPYGCGQHPYLTLGTPTVDELVLTAPGSSVLISDERGEPTVSQTVGRTEFDFRRGRAIGATRLDNAFTDLQRDERGLAHVRLEAPSGDAVTLWMDESYGYVMLFTGDSRPDVDRRSIAVEPMTCPPNAFRSGTALLRLEPGKSVSCSWGISPWPICPAPDPQQADAGALTRDLSSKRRTARRTWPRTRTR